MKREPVEKYVEIVARVDKAVVSRMGPFAWRKAEKVERGARINLDHENYFTRIV